MLGASYSNSAGVVALQRSPFEPSPVNLTTSIAVIRPNTAFIYTTAMQQYHRSLDEAIAEASEEAYPTPSRLALMRSGEMAHLLASFYSKQSEKLQIGQFVLLAALNDEGRIEITARYPKRQGRITVFVEPDGSKLSTVVLEGNGTVSQGVMYF